MNRCENKNTLRGMTQNGNLKIKLFKLIFMARFIKILEQIRPIAEGATARLVPIKADEDA